VIGEFKDGAFIIAVTSQVPVLPVAIDGTCSIWPPGRTAVRGGQVRLMIGSPLPTSGLTYHDVPILREQARYVICSARVKAAGEAGPMAIPRGNNDPAAPSTPMWWLVC
jgi:1-acyl-sn-glycerol-3-phosphate acyltransferase